MNPLSRGNAPSNGPGWSWRILCAIAALMILWLVLTLTGCAADRVEQTQQQRQEHTELDRSFAIRGTVSVPTTRPDGAIVAAPIGVDLVVNGTGADDTTGTSSGQAHSRTTIEAPEIASAVVSGLKQAFPALGMLASMGPAPAPAGGGWSNIDTGTTTAAALALAGLIERHIAASNAKAELRGKTAADPKASA